MEQSAQQSTVYDRADEQQSHAYYEAMLPAQAQLHSVQLQPKQKNFWLSLVWTIVQMVIVGVVTYVLMSFIFGMSIWNSMKIDTVAPGPGLDSAVGSMLAPDEVVGSKTGAETVPVLDIPEQVMAGQHFEYTIARSTYSAEGVGAVYIDFGDGTRMEYVSGNAPETSQHAYADTGRYTATLTIVDARGVEHTDTHTVLVGDAHQDSAQGPEIVSV